MGYMNEYLDKNEKELQEELGNVISQYNKMRGTILMIYASAISKAHIPDVAMSKDDYYTFFDFLKDEKSENIDILIETPGGSGDAAEEIARFLHKKFKNISFVIPGEAKSAGTILALSGHDILMTNTGSLGPIDAQVRIGRSYVSAHDYIEWINEKRNEAQKKGALNPLDAIMIAQISPGELLSVYHSLKYAEDLVKEWLPSHKFNSWNVTESRQIEVSEEMKQQRAKEVAEVLTNHTLWREHGRSIKIDDLKETVKLKVIEIDQDQKLAELVYRIHTIVRMLFSKTAIHKIYAMENQAIFKTAERRTANYPNQPENIARSEVAEVTVQCPNCQKKYKLFLKFKNKSIIDNDFKKKGLTPYPSNEILKCDCGTNIELKPMRVEIERQSGKKVILGDCGLICKVVNLIKKVLNKS
jgi:hypothetical protein